MLIFTGVPYASNILWQGRPRLLLQREWEQGKSGVGKEGKGRRGMQRKEKVRNEDYKRKIDEQ